MCVNRGGGGGGAMGNENTLSFTDVDKYRAGSMMKTTGTVDITKPVTVTITGRTYDHRDTLKSEGFKFNSGDKSWSIQLVGKSKNQIMGKIYDAGRWKPKVRGARIGYTEMYAHLSN